MSSLWDEIKDLFKTDKQLEEERQQKINSALEKESDVSKRLAELEKQYNDSLPKDEEIDFDKIFPTQSGLKEIEYAPESDEDIAKRAQSAREPCRQLFKLVQTLRRVERESQQRLYKTRIGKKQCRDKPYRRA